MNIGSSIGEGPVGSWQASAPPEVVVNGVRLPNVTVCFENLILEGQAVLCLVSVLSQVAPGVLEVPTAPPEPAVPRDKEDSAYRRLLEATLADNVEKITGLYMKGRERQLELRLLQAQVAALADRCAELTERLEESAIPRRNRRPLLEEVHS